MLDQVCGKYYKKKLKRKTSLEGFTIRIFNKTKGWNL